MIDFKLAAILFGLSSIFFIFFEGLRYMIFRRWAFARKWPYLFTTLLFLSTISLLWVPLYLANLPLGNEGFAGFIVAMFTVDNWLRDRIDKALQNRDDCNNEN